MSYQHVVVQYSSNGNESVYADGKPFNGTAAQATDGLECYLVKEVEPGVERHFYKAPYVPSVYERTSIKVDGQTVWQRRDNGLLVVRCKTANTTAGNQGKLYAKVLPRSVQATIKAQLNA